MAQTKDLRSLARSVLTRQNARASLVDDPVIIEDVKALPAAPAPASTALSTTDVGKRSMAAALGRKPIECLLGGQALVTSAANTALSLVAALDVTQAADWSGFSALYDEARCIGMDIHLAYELSGVPTTVGAWAAGNFDPANRAAPVSVVDICTNAYHLGPYLLWNSQTIVPQLASTAKKGQAPCLRIPSSGLAKPTSLGTGTDAAFVGGDWFSTGATAAYVGYLKAYGNACGAGVTNTGAYFVVYRMQFRARS
jgi:hypothetical protein